MFRRHRTKSRPYGEKGLALQQYNLPDHEQNTEQHLASRRAARTTAPARYAACDDGFMMARPQ
jgi:hypothetical protein